MAPVKYSSPTARQAIVTIAEAIPKKVSRPAVALVLLNEGKKAGVERDDVLVAMQRLFNVDVVEAATLYHRAKLTMCKHEHTVH